MSDVMNVKVSQSVSGVSALSLLGVLFVALKLFGVISWSWWLVLAPFLAVPALFLTFGVGVLLFAVWAVYAEKRAMKKDIERRQRTYNS